MDRQQKKNKDQLVAQARKEKMEAQESKKSARAPRQVDVETEKHAAKASGKRPQKGQGRITNPKTNESNQYR